MEAKQSDKDVVQAIEKFNKLSLLKNKAISEHQLCLDSITKIELQLEQCQSDFDLMKLQQTSLIDENLILEQEFIDADDALNRNNKNKVRALELLERLKSIKNKLIFSTEIEIPDNGFEGAEWYIPKFEDGTFDLLAIAMGWGGEQKKIWQNDYDKSQSYHGGHIGFIKNYIKDITAVYSPRQNLLKELDPRITVLTADIKRYEKNLKKISDEKVLANKQHREEKSSEITRAGESFNEAKVKLEEIKLSLEQNNSSLAEIESQKKRLERLCDLNSMSVTLKKLIIFKTRFLESQSKEINLNQLELISDKLKQSESYTNLITKFCDDFNFEKEKYFYKDIKIKLEESSFIEFSNEDIFKELNAQILVIDLLSEHSSEIKLSSISVYEQQHAKYQQEVQKHQEQRAANELQLQAQQGLKKKELEQRQINIDKYLGDGKHKAGILSDYLTQRATVFFIKDFFSKCLEFLFKWPFAYQSDKNIRQNFVNNELRPALEKYKNTGNNYQLNILINSDLIFFKPRAIDNSGYRLTLAYLLENLREELLTKEQQENTINAII